MSEQDRKGTACRCGIVAGSRTKRSAQPQRFDASDHGIDWSSTIVEERDKGVTYKNAQGVAKPLEEILVAAGVNMVRQRVWTVEGDYGISYNLELAKRANASGLMFGLNLHYSDGFTNPGLQDIPTGWPTATDALEAQVTNYTAEVCAAFAAAGLYPEMITIGNEIDRGILCSTGKYDQPENLARLLHAGSAAIRASALGSTTKIVTHLAHGYDADLQDWPSDQLSIPLSTAGQTEYITMVADTLKKIPNATGLNYWEAAWISNAVLGSSCESNVMFGGTGKAYDSLAVFGTI
ncbi:glycosyl hydrolase family 53-domain-containing protein [Colletotrichum phormii]|uniref:Arabinogalactan endo-beta-1,4-galactanase n=1 Tax=Colletotrichum phormii TaxID=359342 RepID=A0AAJ0E9A7_9PEZI|nr:glycosyl hydrolase family 53-domain-containing protein [Colletotrichum phormii]KAK1623714.1 glycosyl hydrolase family 53-domain-containing protein [Colletotrichum phormii]